MTRPGICRICGCTDDDACFGPCAWADPGLCTACVGTTGLGGGDGPCADCGDPNIVWFTDSVFWNNVLPADESPILCLPCFIARAELAGFRPTAWHVTPEWPWRVAGPTGAPSVPLVEDAS